MKILLLGNPNVGKSVVFSRLTGVHVISSNYPGTTVGYTKGFMRFRDERADVIDVPGTYTLDPTCEAERVAREMLEEGDVAIDVVDATNLERNLYLTSQLLELEIPLVLALNVSDSARSQGIRIDKARLSTLLGGAPIVETVGHRGAGVDELVRAAAGLTGLGRVRMELVA